MSDLYWLSEAQVERLRPYLPKPHGKRRVDDRRVLSEIIYIQRIGLMGVRAEPAISSRASPNAPDADWFRNALIELGISPCIRSKLSRTVQIPHDAALYRLRHKIDNMFARLKDWSRVPTRYDRCPILLISACAVAAIVIYWL
jgi:transposase